MAEYLEFEKPIKDLQERIEKIQRMAKARKPKKSVERLLRMLTAQRAQLEHDIYSSITPWQRTLIARHTERPSTTDYLRALCKNVIELHGDRLYGDDPSIVGGLATLGEQSICVIGHEKGKGLKNRMKRNFGMPNPEGYRKALRLMKLAEKFQRPILTFIDTPGAYPGVGAEERGQSEAIARNLMVMSRLRVPIIAVIIGEGGSGGALALGVADCVLMLEQSIYSVISPEGCAAILWNEPTKAPEAAAALKMTGEELLKLGVIDGVIPEPFGGAHRDKEQTLQNVQQAIDLRLRELKNIPADKLIQTRYDKYRRMSALSTGTES